MTIDHLDTGPSSIRDDSICESSLPPNKSSGDIVERLRETTERMAINANVPMLLWQEHSSAALDAAAEIERLRRENQNLKQDLKDRLDAWTLAMHGKLNAESAVAAAWEKAEKHAVAALGQHGSMMFIQEHGWAGLMEVVASAIRAAGAEKTAESGHSPSTHNSASE